MTGKCVVKVIMTLESSELRFQWRDVTDVISGLNDMRLVDDSDPSLNHCVPLFEWKHSALNTRCSDDYTWSVSTFG
jgi:hypothetical protein